MSVLPRFSHDSCCTGHQLGDNRLLQFRWLSMEIMWRLRGDLRFVG